MLAAGPGRGGAGEAGTGSVERQGSQGRGGLPSDWVLFNDFCITPTTVQEVVSARPRPIALQCNSYRAVRP